MTPESSEPSESSVPPQAPAWHPLRRFLFRFSSVYFLLYLLATPYFYVPFWGSAVTTWTLLFWNRFLEFWNRTLFEIAPEGAKLEFRGVGDVKSHLYLLFGIVMTALVGALLWSLLDRRRSSYRLAARGLTIGVSFLVGSVMLYYGSLKIFDAQFGFPLLDRLLMTYGESRGMDLVWILMGISNLYANFAGWAESVGGCMLFFQRSRPLGALILVVVLSHVVLLNFCFAMPVKIFSLHLLLMSCVLLLPVSNRIFRFALGRPAPAVELRPLFESPKLAKAVSLLQIVLVLTLFGAHLEQSRQQEAQYSLERQPIYGIFDVETFTVDGEDRPPLVTDETRWRLILFDVVGWVTIQRMPGKTTSYQGELDLEARTLALLSSDGARLEWTLEQPSADTLILEGEIDGEALRVVTKRRDLNEFTLANRKFRWVSESPFDL